MARVVLANGNSGSTIRNALNSMTSDLYTPLTGDASAAFDVESTTQGFLLPQMTTTQKAAISSPKEGLLVYDLTLHALCVYNGSAWKTVTAV